MNLPVLSAPVERTTSGTAPSAGETSADQSALWYFWRRPFAGDSDE